ncbi:MAG: hypothetical protein ACM3ZV_02140 [Bacillota bacterium]
MTAAYRFAFWTAVIFTLAMALLPHPPHVPPPSDKLQHALAFATLALLATLAFPSAGALRVFATLSTFGALIEILQAIPFLYRDSDVMDWATDMIAAGALLALAWCWDRMRGGKSS